MPIWRVLILLYLNISSRMKYIVRHYKVRRVCPLKSVVKENWRNEDNKFVLSSSMVMILGLGAVRETSDRKTNQDPLFLIPDWTGRVMPYWRNWLSSVWFDPGSRLGFKISLKKFVWKTDYSTAMILTKLHRSGVIESPFLGAPTQKIGHGYPSVTLLSQTPYPLMIFTQS